jgi:general secretion pathway protein G
LQAAQTQIEYFGAALDAFRLDVGRYPSTDEGLDILVTKPEGVATWDGPYLKKRVPLDPWKNRYEYKSPGDHGEYDIISFGADGKEGGEGESQDILSWEGLSSGESRG